MNQIMQSDQRLVTTFIPSLHPNLGGFVHAPIMHSTMPSVSMYVQLNFIVIKTRHFNPLNQVVFPLPITDYNNSKASKSWSSYLENMSSNNVMKCVILKSFSGVRDRMYRLESGYNDKMCISI
jgi:hypothetical protein